MKKYLCRYSNCTILLNNPGYCPKHIKDKPAPFANAIRFNEALYKTTQWKAMRKEHLLNNSHCVQCGATKADGLRIDIHHIDPPRGNETKFFDTDNLITLCENCHRVVTAKEIRDRK